MAARATVRRATAVILIASGLGACGYVDRYEEAVYDMEPRYCYRSLAAVECYDRPYPRYAEHLVNYQGPHPSRFPEPEKPGAPELRAPAPVDYWVKDVEPVPRPAPVNYRQGSLPWLEEPIRPTPVPGDQVSGAAPDTGAPQRAPSVPVDRPRPTRRAPGQGVDVPLADPNQGSIPDRPNSAPVPLAPPS